MKDGAKDKSWINFTHKKNYFNFSNIVKNSKSSRSISPNSTVLVTS
jgi:hypothetical protein